MNSVHSNLISESQILKMDILSSTTDSIEKKFNPRLDSVPFLNEILPFLLFHVPFLNIIFDHVKSQKINAKLIDLQATELDKTSLDYEKAVSALSFQEEVYKNTLNYIHTAKKMKTLYALGGFTICLGMVTANNLFPQESRAIARFGLLTAAVYAYGIYHCFSEGASLNSTNRTLAKNFESIV